MDDVAELGAEPSKKLFGGDWMIWMIHRAWLNDPSLKELDFTGMHMPLPHDEQTVEGD